MWNQGLNSEEGLSTLLFYRCPLKAKRGNSSVMESTEWIVICSFFALPTAYAAKFFFLDRVHPPQRPSQDGQANIHTKMVQAWKGRFQCRPSSQVTFHQGRRAPLCISTLEFKVAASTSFCSTSPSVLWREANQQAEHLYHTKLLPRSNAAVWSIEMQNRGHPSLPYC